MAFHLACLSVAYGINAVDVPVYYCRNNRLQNGRFDRIVVFDCHPSLGKPLLAEFLLAQTGDSSHRVYSDETSFEFPVVHLSRNSADVGFDSANLAHMLPEPCLAVGPFHQSTPFVVNSRF